MNNQSVSKKSKETKKPRNLRWLRDRDREMVKGMFKFYEVPGGSMDFVYKAYKEDQVERYDMVDGEIYTIPLGVARHLNTSGWYPIHAYTMDERGVPSMKIGQKKRRYGFQSLEFTEIEGVEEVSDTGIVTVEKIG